MVIWTSESTGCKQTFANLTKHLLTQPNLAI